MDTGRVRVYLVLIVTIIALAITAQIVIQFAIARQKNDTHIINQAGRQRMLSQKLMKAIYQCKLGNCDIETLQKDNELWNAVHNGLQNGDPKLNLNSLQDKEIMALFAELNPIQQTLYLVVKQVNDTSGIEWAMQEVEAMEEAFLIKMDNIVTRLERRAEKRLNNLVLVEILIAILSMCILIGEVLYIVRPTLKELALHNARLKRIAWKQSHEVRKPVTNIIGLTSIINKDKLDEETQKTFDYIHQSAKDLDVIIHEIVKETEAERHKPSK